MKNGSILAEFSKEGYGSESSVSPMMMTKMMVMMIALFRWMHTVPRKSTKYLHHVRPCWNPRPLVLKQGLYSLGLYQNAIAQSFMLSDCI
jgi:hypothetical protein